MNSLVVQIATSAIVAFGVAFLASWLARDRAHRERLWDRKAQAFSIILEALYDFANWFDGNLEDAARHRDTNEKVEQQRIDAYGVAKDRLYRTLSKEAWLLPATVQERIEVLEKALNERHQDWLEMLDSGSRTVAKAQADLVAIAKRELGRP